MKIPKIFAFGIVLSFALFSSSEAQFNSSWNQSYQHTNSFNYSNEGRKVATDASGNIFVLADATSDLDPNGATSTTPYYYTVLIKYDSTGNLISQKAINVQSHLVSGFKSTSGFGLEVDAAGNVYIGFSYFEQTNDFDVYIRKYSNNLAIQWTYIYKPSSKDIGVDMTLATGGNVYAVILSTLNGIETSSILKANQAQVVSTPYFSFQPDVEYPTAISHDIAGDIYVTGYKLVSGIKNIFTASLTPAATLKWSTVYNGGNPARDDFGTDIACDSIGSVYVTGTSDRGLPELNNSFAMKQVTQTGKVYWISYFDNNNENDFGKIINTEFAGTNQIFMAAYGGDAAYIYRINAITGTSFGKATNNPIPVNPITAINSVDVTDFKITPDLNFYITGNINATEPSGSNFSAGYLTRYNLVPAARGNMAFRHTGNIQADGSSTESYSSVGIAFNPDNNNILWLRDAYLSYTSHQRESVKLNSYDGPSPLRTASPEKENLQPLVYPNPANTSINFGVYGNSQINWEITDLQGNIILNGTSSGVSEIDLSGISAGHYIIRASNKAEIKPVQFIIQK